MDPNRFEATYLIETPTSLEHAAEVLSGEQSSGTFVKIPGETSEIRTRFRAQVKEITDIEEGDTPSLPGALKPTDNGKIRCYKRGKIRISFPLENVGANLPTLLSTVAGNLFELRELSGIRLLDLELPHSFAESYPGPQFSIAGTRERVNVYGRPIIGTIVKPSVGLTPEATAGLVSELAEGGIDFIKDDELMANPPYSPIEKRVDAVMKVLNDVADRTGKKVMYAFNITDELEAMLRHHDYILKAGGDCIMISLNSVGLVGTGALRRHCALPIHGHRNGWGMLSRHPNLGMEFSPYQKIWRLVGADHIHVNGLRNKFFESDESVVRSIKACLTPLFDGYFAMPTISSGQWGGQAPETYRKTGTVDVIYLAGGGIIAHPGGASAGVRAIKQAWQAAVEGVSLEDYARDHHELHQSLRKFGGNVGN